MSCNKIEKCNKNKFSHAMRFFKSQPNKIKNCKLITISALLTQKDEHIYVFYLLYKVFFCNIKQRCNSPLADGVIKNCPPENLLLQVQYGLSG